jgi:hypothetical protein
MLKNKKITKNNFIYTCWYDRPNVVYICGNIGTTHLTYRVTNVNICAGTIGQMWCTYVKHWYNTFGLSCENMNICAGTIGQMWCTYVKHLYNTFGLSYENMDICAGTIGQT